MSAIYRNGHETFPRYNWHDGMHALVFASRLILIQWNAVCVFLWGDDNCIFCFFLLESFHFCLFLIWWVTCWTMTHLLEIILEYAFDLVWRPSNQEKRSLETLKKQQQNWIFFILSHAILEVYRMNIINLLNDISPKRRQKKI